MNPNKLVFFNTIITYLRTIFSVCVSLFTTRWVLKELGASDFGLYSIVGSVLMVLVFVSSKLVSGLMRFYAIEIGKENSDGLKKYFNAAISVNIIVSAFFILISVFLGEFFISTVLNIPIERISVSILVFKISVVSTVFSLLSTPYIAMFVAKQNFLEISIFTLLQSFLEFIGVFSLRYFEYDKLFLYSLFMGAIYIIIYLSQITRARFKYSECRISINLLYQKSVIFKILKYSFWNILADLGHLVRTQGISILTNIYFSTPGNAALGIANRVGTQSAVLTNALGSALSPAIISQEGAKNYDKSIQMSLLAPKIGVYLMFIFSVPILIEMQYLLELWLGEYPRDAVSLSSCFILMYIVEKTTLGQEILLQAKGKIAKMQVGVLVSYTLSILFSYIMIHLNFGTISIGLATLFSMIIAKFFVMFCASKISITFMKWISTILLPTLLILLILLGISYLVTLFMQASLLRISIIFVVNFFFSSFFLYFFLLNSIQRKLLLSYLLPFTKKNRY